MFTQHTTCRACGESHLVKVADFGATPLVNDFRHAGEPHAGYAPLEVMVCPTCWLPQLSVVVDPREIAKNRPNYMVLFAWNFADEIVSKEFEYLHRGGKFIVPLPKMRFVP